MESYLSNEELKEVVTTNLVKYRKANKLTQIELAEKLQYSDKNISKWERGDSLPDLVVLKQIADIYGITVNDLMTPSEEVLPKKDEEEHSEKVRHRFFTKQQMLICSLSVGIVWLVATIAFVLCNIFLHDFELPLWHMFIVALPISAIIMLVFSSIWCTNLLDCINVSILIWTVALAFDICIQIPYTWFIYILAIPVQILDILWFSLRKVNKTKNKKESSTIKKSKKQEINEEHN